MNWRQDTGDILISPMVEFPYYVLSIFLKKSQWVLWFFSTQYYVYLKETEGGSEQVKGWQGDHELKNILFKSCKER